MKISELIYHLERLKKELGDVQCVTDGAGTGSGDTIRIESCFRMNVGSVNEREMVVFVGD
jgi:hypothetical protein